MSQNYFCHTCLCFFLILNAISICISSRNSKCGTRIQPVRECISQQHHKGRSTRSCATLTWGHWKLHLHIPWLPFIWACYCPLRCVEIDLLAPAEFVIVLFIIYIRLSISALHKAFYTLSSHLNHSVHLCNARHDQCIITHSGPGAWSEGVLPHEQHLHCHQHHCNHICHHRRGNARSVVGHTSSMEGLFCVIHWLLFCLDLYSVSYLC